MKPMLRALMAVACLALPLAAPAAENRMMIAAEFPGPGHAGYLGVGLRDVSDDRVTALKLKDTRGVEIIALDHDGPAAKVGIREHDVILEMNGQEVASEEQLRRMLRETPAGRKADLTLSRDGQEVKVEVVLGDRSAVEVGALQNLDMRLNDVRVEMPELGNLVPANVMDLDVDAGDGPVVFGPSLTGANVESLGPQLAQFFGAKDGTGVLVKDVRHDSAAAKAGLKAGDVIVRAAGQPVPTRMEWERVTHQNRGKAVGVDILRDRHSQKLTITPPARTQGTLVPESYVIEDGDICPDEMAELTIQQDPKAQAELNEQMAQLRAEMEAHHADIEKAMADVKTQMDSPEFKKEMEDAQRQGLETAAEWQKNSAELKAEIDKAAAEWKENGPAMQAEMAKARAEAEKAAAEWKPSQPELEKQMRDAQEEIKKAAEEMRLQTTPMD
jgi:membrane-associated protease RseP (regulator of RpoE activity)